MPMTGAAAWLDGFDGPFEKVPDVVKPASGHVAAVPQGGAHVISGHVNDGFVAINRLLQAKQDVSRATTAFTAGGRSYPAGTVILSVDSSTQVTLTNNSTGPGTGVSMGFSSALSGFWVLDYAPAADSNEGKVTIKTLSGGYLIKAGASATAVERAESGWASLGFTQLLGDITVPFDPTTLTAHDDRFIGHIWIQSLHSVTDYLFQSGTNGTDAATPRVCVDLLGARPDRDRLQGRVEIDESYVGGEEAGVRGRETERKSIVVIAVELKRRKTAHVRLRLVRDVSAETLTPVVQEVVEPGSTVLTDAWGGYAWLYKVGFKHVVEQPLSTRRLQTQAEAVPGEEAAVASEDSDLVIEIPPLNGDQLPCQYAFSFKIVGGELLPE